MNSPSDDLERLAPGEAVELYLEGRRDELSDATVEAHDYRLRAFVAWCVENDVDDLRQLDGRDLYRYRIWRRDGGYSDQELRTVTLRGDMQTVRVFLRFCGSIGAVPEELHERVAVPMATGEDVSESTLQPDRAVAILEYLDRYEYASRRHVVLLLLWHTGCRTGELRALDVDDVDLHGDRPEGQGPALKFAHRPGTGTPLKNRQRGERWNAIAPSVAAALEDWMADQRPRVVDEHGREPLVTTDQGRIARSTVRDTLYRVTRPCWRGAGCPHGKDPDTCEWTSYARMSRCPSSRSPHDVRSGRATAYRLDDVPRAIVGDRLDMSDEMLEKHYDRRSARRRAEQRRGYLSDS